MKITPLNKRVLLKLVNQNSQTIGGIYIPTSKQENVGEVLAVGKEVELIKVGDKVIYSSFAGNKINNDNEEQIIVEEKEIIATIS